MGCTPSRSIHRTRPALSCDLCPRDEHEEQARNMLSRIRLIPPVQRRRARSVGIENGTYWVYWRPGREENGTYWVYWRPGREENGRRQEEVELYAGEAWG